MVKNLDFREILKPKLILGPGVQVVKGVAYDSREIKEGYLFVCIEGENTDGHRYIRAAIDAGAVGIIGSNSDQLLQYAGDHPSLTFVKVNDGKAALSQLSASFYNHPTENLSMVGVTGTNGKTTVTSYIRSILNALAIPAGSLGTAGIWDEKKKTKFKQSVPTTPEAPDLHRVLRHFVSRGLKAVAMEATSIALEQKRLLDISYDVAVHTNLTPEHLEFHGTMARYKEAKLKLFRQSKKAVVNRDDAGMADDIIQQFTGPLLTYGIDNRKADISADHIKITTEGSVFTLRAWNDSFFVQAPVYGKYNVSNLLAAIGGCLQMGISIEKVLEGLRCLEGPEGRFQQYYASKLPYQIIMDYAHTPDALEKVLEVASKLSRRRLIVMITGVGLRDPNKRPLMAKVAERYADEVVVTVDHPGFFDRREILNDVLEGFTKNAVVNTHALLHREEAIHYALDIAHSGDLVLLTGIGFGGYQVIKGENVPYSETAVIEQYLSKEKSHTNCNE
ncbi:UDP-N-acetylmuramoyl-L-alanyl-D-glutamate--2,6-diaminopimelate ligase [Halobacillus sp. MO56]